MRRAEASARGGLRRRAVLAVAAAMLATLFAPAAPAQACAFETIPLHTFKVTIKPRSDAYRVGETVQLDVKVVRPADSDPLNAGLPWPDTEKEPAEDVNVGIGVRVGDVFLFGLGVTDASGKTLVKVKLKSYTPSGTARVDSFAYLNQLTTPCLIVQEYGYTSLPDAFRVEK